MEYLIEHGVNVNIEDRHGQTPLFESCLSNDLNSVKSLVDHGADINKKKKNKMDETPLFISYLIYRNNIFGTDDLNRDIIRYLLEYGACINE